MEKIHWHKAFNSDYLGSCDIESGQSLKAIIKSVTVKSVKNTDGKESDRNVAEFTDPKIKPMILNATNCKIVQKFAKSPYLNDWVNIAVEIYVKNIRAFGEDAEGLRLKDRQPTFEKPELLQTLPAWPNIVNHYKATQSFEKIEAQYKVSEAVKSLIKLQANG